MFPTKNYLTFSIVLLLILMITISYGISNNNERFIIGNKIALNVMLKLHSFFEMCLSDSMPNKHFMIDNVQNYINYPAKTTVGLAPRYTGNRRYFANLLNSVAFKDMLAADEQELRQGMIKKIKYCDETVMDQETLKDFYEREVDQTKL